MRLSVLKKFGLVGLHSSLTNKVFKKKKVLVNDIHSQLNETPVAEIFYPQTSAELVLKVQNVKEKNQVISICGGRHSMGGQQFASDSILIDMSKLNKIVTFDTERGLITAEAGVEWPELIEYIRTHGKHWSIIQKQTGADNLTLGGSLSSNVHGRGLTLHPIIHDVESFTLLNAEGKQLTCSRTENYELFKLVIGGYGLFGIITTVTLRLTQALKLQRIVKVIPINELLPSLEERIDEGFLYGDFQFNTDTASADFLTKGVFSCYKPTTDIPQETGAFKRLTPEQWQQLYLLAHTDHKKAFELYAAHYLGTSGQMYDLDLHQMSYYLHGYHRAIDKALGAKVRGSEMITEIYVPREKISTFMKEAAEYFRTSKTQVFYGTIRLIEKDEESYLAWARESYICIIFNLHVVHNPEGLEDAQKAFCDLIDIARRMGGSYYLTYHKWASKNQVEACYPQFSEFLKLKKVYDPEELFQSDWYRHYRKMFFDY